MTLCWIQSPRQQERKVRKTEGITNLPSVGQEPCSVLIFQVGMHFMYPVPIMPLVEIIRGISTDDAVSSIPSHISSKDAQIQHSAVFMILQPACTVKQLLALPCKLIKQGVYCDILPVFIQATCGELRHARHNHTWTNM